MLGLLPKSLGLDLSCVHLTLMVTQLSPWSHGVLLLSGGGQSQVLPLARSGPCSGQGPGLFCSVAVYPMPALVLAEWGSVCLLHK